MLQVRDLMTDEVLSLTPRDDLLSLKDLMSEHDFRHVPVVDGADELVGLVSMRDLICATQVGEDLPLSIRNDILRTTRVGDIMTTEVATADPEQDLAEAARIMFEHKFGCLPVVVGTQLVGILTEADFVRYHLREA